MSTTEEQSDAEGATRSKRPVLSLIAIVLTILSGVTWASQLAFGPFSPKPPISETVGDLAGDIVARARGRLDGTPAPDRDSTSDQPSHVDRDRLALGGALIAGVGAIGLGVLGVALGEPRGASVSACTFATFILGLQLLSIALALVLFVALVAVAVIALGGLSF